MFDQRQVLVEIDFVNNYIVDSGGVNQYTTDARDKTTHHIPFAPKKRKIDPALKENFLNTLDPFWHSDKDRIVLFQYFSDGYYFCQRKKQKVDFATESTYWNDYTFKGASQAQAEAFYEKLNVFREVVKEVKKLQVARKVEEIDKEVIFFEQRYYKLRRQRESLLNVTDWRVLPDIEDSYEGQKAEWIRWRAHIRDMVLKKPEDPMFLDENGVISGLKYFKYAADYRFPIDPQMYRELYKDGVDEFGRPAPPFMDETDPEQWVKQEAEASSDFFRANEQNMYNLAGRAIPARRKVQQNLIDLMKEIAVDDVIDVNWDSYYTDDSELTE